MAQFLAGLASGFLLFLLTGLLRFTWNELTAAKKLIRHVAPILIYLGMTLLLLSGIVFLFGIGDFNHLRSVEDLRPSRFAIILAVVGGSTFTLPFLMVWLAETVVLLKPLGEVVSTAPQRTDMLRENTG